jgi:hypothetical protein
MCVEIFKQNDQMFKVPKPPSIFPSSYHFFQPSSALSFFSFLSHCSPAHYRGLVWPNVSHQPNNTSLSLPVTDSRGPHINFFSYLSLPLILAWLATAPPP